MRTVDAAQPFRYADRLTPNSYRCRECGAEGVKLWREYQTFLDHQSLLCGECTVTEQGRDRYRLRADGRYEGDHGLPSPAIGWRVPAIPTESNDTFWGYTSVPADGCEWWYALPLREQRQAREEER